MKNISKKYKEMFGAIQQFVNSSLEKIGYSRTKIGNIKYENLIKEIEGLYKEFLFEALPTYDETRIRLISKLLGTGISEAIYILNYLHKSLELEGDICEFGVAQGATSALMAYEIRKTNKKIWLFDSFEGLTKPSENDILKDDIFNLGSIEAYEGTMSCKIDMVKERLNDIAFPLSRTKIVPGFIEKTINYPNLPDKVCFAYLDFDFYEPTLIALNFLDKVLQTNGFVIVDDYDFFSTGVKTAVDEFIQSNKQKYRFSLPIKAAGHFCVIEKLLKKL